MPKSTVFDDLAHQIVHQTTLSLYYASTQISTKTSETDAQLFLIKHLLILKQQIVAFDIEFVTPDVSVDFSGVTNTFWELRERGGLFNPRNLFRLMGKNLLPRVVDNMLDAKVELDGRLRTVINDFTDSFATKMTAPLPSLPSPPTSKPQTTPTSSPPPITLQKARQAVHQTCETIEKEVPNLRALLDDYLPDVRTKETLVGAVQDRTLQLYEDFFDAYMALDKSSRATTNGKAPENEVWELDTFADWCEGVFRVGVAAFRLDEDYSDQASRAGSA